ncbi:MAG TPA: hypothetical protein VIL20_22250 [Sandaracinaceae bacterium]
MAGRAWRAWVIGLSTIAALMAGACRTQVVVRTDPRTERYTRHLIQIAARDTGCHPSALVPTQIASQPAVFTVTGCQAPVEYWLQCGRRNCRWRRVARLEESAAASLGCAPTMIAVQPTQTPNVRYASGCGRTASFTVVCNGAACGWAPTGPVQGAVAAAPAQPPPATAVVVPGPEPAPPTAIQSQLQAQREAILSCVDSGPLTLRVRWTADGQVLVQLPPEMVGTAAEGCVQAVLGGLRVTAQAAGEIVVPIQ